MNEGGWALTYTRGMASSPPVSAQKPGIRILENQVINREVVLPDLSLSEGKKMSS